MVDCEREQDLLDAIATGRWPGQYGDDMRDHVSACHVCADLAEIAGPLLDARDRAWDEARVPTAGAVWWRAQLRARREAAHQAARPITVAQAAAVSLGVLMMLMLAGLVAPWIGEPLGRAVTIARDIRLVPGPVSGIEAVDTWGWGLLLLLGPCLILAPVALYFAVARD